MLKHLRALQLALEEGPPDFGGIPLCCSRIHCTRSPGVHAKAGGAGHSSRGFGVLQADDPRVHRGRHQRDGSPQLASAASAYASSGLVCDMWHLFGAKAKAAGYRPFGKERCGVAHGKRSKRNNAG